MVEDRKDFERTIRRLKDNVYKDDIGLDEVFNNKQLNMLEDIIYYIERDIRRAMEDKDNLNNNEIIGKVENFLLIYLRNLNLINIKDQVRYYMNDFIKLVYNWNSIYECGEINNIISAIQNFNRFYQSVINLIENSRGVIERLERFDKFNPPAFNLSKDFLEKIKEDLED